MNDYMVMGLNQASSLPEELMWYDPALGQENQVWVRGLVGSSMAYNTVKRYGNIPLN